MPGAKPAEQLPAEFPAQHVKNISRPLIHSSDFWSLKIVACPGAWPQFGSDSNCERLAHERIALMPIEVAREVIADAYPT